MEVRQNKYFHLPQCSINHWFPVVIRKRNRVLLFVTFDDVIVDSEALAGEGIVTIIKCRSVPVSDEEQREGRQLCMEWVRCRAYLSWRHLAYRSCQRILPTAARRIPTEVPQLAGTQRKVTYCRFAEMIEFDHHYRVFLRSDKQTLMRFRCKWLAFVKEIPHKPIQHFKTFREFESSKTCSADYLQLRSRNSVQSYFLFI